MTDHDSEMEITSGGAVLARLQRLGVDAVFTNSGTDFPPIIEGLAEAEARGLPLPNTYLVPHEHVAVGMAHGYYFATGRAQAVLLHTNVGLANGVTGTINAAADQIPMILMSGRTPTLEHGRFGARTVPIGWGQEMRDQTAMVREAVKWDYELRFPEQIGEVLDRAHAIATSTPPGPTYVSLPREVLCEPCPAGVMTAEVSMRPATVVADDATLDRAAELLASAERPLILAQRGAGTGAGFEALARLADHWSIPVCQYWAVANAVSADHPTNVGNAPAPWLTDADVVLVVDSLAPWMPAAHQPPEEATIIQLGPDPLQARFPIRNFRADVSIVSEVGPALVGLAAALDRRAEAESSGAGSDRAGSDRAGSDRAGSNEAGAGRAARRARIDDHVRTHRAAVEAEAADGARTPMTKAWAAHCLGRAIEGRSATVTSELGVPMEPLGPIGHDAWHDGPHSGGLGWSLPCALGLKLADPERLVVATMGDGSYLFANPVACHQTAATYDIPVLTMVLNNGGYGAVRHSVRSLYPTGYAAKEDDIPLTAVPSPDLVMVAQASGAHAERVEDPDELPAAIDRAIEAVTTGRRQALLDVVIGD